MCERNAKIEDYIVNTSNGHESFFIGITDIGSIRMGWAGGMIMAYPEHHRVHQLVMDNREALADMTFDQIEEWIDSIKA